MRRLCSVMLCVAVLTACTSGATPPAPVDALINPEARAVSIPTDAAAVGLPEEGCYAVRDLWAHTDATTTADLDRSVPAHDVTILRVTPGCR